MHENSPTRFREGSEVLEGISAGACYPTKPIDRPLLLAIVESAVTRYQAYLSLQEELLQDSGAMQAMNLGEFRFQTLRQARHLAKTLANGCPDPTKAVVGLLELLVNAVEHGNLGISYTEKSKLIDQDNWKAEVDRRIRLPENISKFVDVHFERRSSRIVISIKDQGKGFEWRQYLKLDEARAFERHGRGIALALAFSFNRLKYCGAGNEVIAEINTTGTDP